jgi:hypothetical protein
MICESNDPGVVAAMEELRRLLNTTPRRGGEGAKAAEAPVIHLQRSDSPDHPQGYEITISVQGVKAGAKTDAGLFYALQTLIQIARQYGTSWPCMHIVDWPDYPRRGFYHDVSRGKVPALHTLLWLVKQLAALKINEFQLYIENVFQFTGHADMCSGTTPLTPADIDTIDKLCRTVHIDFVPSLTSLGHFDKILRLPRYRHLAEVEPAELQRRGIKTWSDDPWTLCVTDPASKTLLEELYADFLPHFSSSLFNICCDESWDLGLGRSAAAAKAGGLGELYVNWVNLCAELAARHGKRVQLWGDIILNHPGLINELPADATLLEWGYAGNHPFAEHGKLFADSGRTFYVCPGTSTWQSLAGRWDNAVANLRNAAAAGLQHNASGFLNTDWGDYGHQQALAVSLLPMAYGAAVSWHGRRDDPDQAALAAGLHIFGDRTGRVAKAVCELGNVYAGITREPLPNASLDFKLFREPWDQKEFLNLADANAMAATMDHIAGIGDIFTILNPNPKQNPNPAFDPQQLLALEELRLTRDQILYTFQRTFMRINCLAGRQVWPTDDATALSQRLTSIKQRYSDLWMRRNKPSRLCDILAIFDQHLHEIKELGWKPQAVARENGLR